MSLGKPLQATISGHTGTYHLHSPSRNGAGQYMNRWEWEQGELFLSISLASQTTYVKILSNLLSGFPTLGL